MTRTETVFIVDDDQAVCRALTRLVRSAGLNCETYGSAQEFLDAYDPASPGCLVLDVRMPGMSGLELQGCLATRCATIPVIFITGHGDVPMSVRAMKAGALDFIQKPFDDQTILEAIEHAIAGDHEDRLCAAHQATVRDRAELLTPREHEVLSLVVSGRLNKQIAQQLGISEKTVKIHRARVMDKMKAESVAELVVLAQAAGIDSRTVTRPRPAFGTRSRRTVEQ